MYKRLLTIAKELFVFSLLFFVISYGVNETRKPNLLDTKLAKSELLSALDSSGKARVGSATEREPSLQRHLTLIYFWGTWCSVCGLVSPTISKLAQDRKEIKVITIAVNSGSDQQLHHYLSEQQLTFGVINDQGGYWSNKYKVKAYPTIFIYNELDELEFIEIGMITRLGLDLRLWWSSIGKST